MRSRRIPLCSARSVRLLEAYPGRRDNDLRSSFVKEGIHLRP